MNEGSLICPSFFLFFFFLPFFFLLLFLHADHGRLRDSFSIVWKKEIRFSVPYAIAVRCRNRQHRVGVSSFRSITNVVCPLMNSYLLIVTSVRNVCVPVSDGRTRTIGNRWMCVLISVAREGEFEFKTSIYITIMTISFVSNECCYCWKVRDRERGGGQRKPRHRKRKRKIRIFTSRRFDFHNQ